MTKSTPAKSTPTKSAQAQAHEDQLRDRRDNPPAPDPEADAMAVAREVRHLFASWSTDTGAVTQEVDAGGVPAVWVTPESANSEGVILYFHGGAYILGDAHHVVKMLGHIAGHAGCRALSVDYRLAPEHAYPAAVEDAVASYRWLLDSGIDAANIVLSGDSAGGGLILAALLAIKDQGLPQPAGAVPISPWADLACSADSWQQNANTELLLDQERLAGIGQIYLQGADPADPLASPVHGELGGLPPLYIQASGYEALLDDCIAVAAAAARAGVDVRLDVFPQMQHVFQYCAGAMPEADDAVQRIGTWVAGVLDSD